VTYESLYLSRTLTDKLTGKRTDYSQPKAQQYSLFEPSVHYA
jgi:hypothetical protein